MIRRYHGSVHVCAYERTRSVKPGGTAGALLLSLHRIYARGRSFFVAPEKV